MTLTNTLNIGAEEFFSGDLEGKGGGGLDKGWVGVGPEWRGASSLHFVVLMCV